MAAGPDDHSGLSSWKEIAAYLGVTVRAAQKWERERGLPIIRLPGKRSVVSARQGDLEAWRLSVAQPSSSKRLRRHHFRYVITALTLAVLALAFFLSRHHPSVPASFHIEQNTLVVMDMNGRELWRKLFDSTLNSTQYNADSNGDHRRFWTGDLDGDGRNEVLFVNIPNAGAATSYLACYSDVGHERWRFVPGRRVASGSEEFENRYFIADFLVAPIGNSPQLKVLVTSVQIPYFPDQVSLLDAHGTQISEYWHSGWLERIAVSKDQIYLGGISNGYKAATLIVLDPEHLSGASAEPDPAHQLQGFPLAQEKLRLLFPRTCINRTFEAYNWVREITVDRSGPTILVLERRTADPASVWYHFTPDFKLRGVGLDDHFRAYHAELRTKDLLDHDFTADEEAKLWDIRVLRGN